MFLVMLENKFNRRTLTILVEAITIFLSALLGGVISLIIMEIKFPLLYLLVITVVILTLLILLIKFWDWYNKPARIDGYRQINHIESNTNELIKEQKEMEERVNRIWDKVKGYESH